MQDVADIFVTAWDGAVFLPAPVCASADGSPGGEIWDGYIVREFPGIAAATAVGLDRFVAITGETVPCARVWVDDVQAGKLVAQHFLRRGYQNFMVLGAPSVVAFAAREEGFCRELRSAGYEPVRFVANSDAVDVVATFAHEADQIVHAILAQPKPLALACPDSAVGRRLVQACRDAGIRVPGEVAVATCDHDDLMALSCRPGLSGVIMPGNAVGYAAASLLHSLLKRDKTVDVGTIVTLPPERYEERGSTDVTAIGDPYLLKALDFMSRNAARSISVETIARHAGVHRRTLEGAFRRQMATTPHRELARLRLQQAHGLLTTTNTPVSKIARMCGYCHVSHFATHFRRQYGCSPLHFRAQLASRSGTQSANGQ